MKSVLVLIFLTIGFGARSVADTTSQDRKFRSSLGFELSFPECWNLEKSLPVGSEPIAKELSLRPGKDCPPAPPNTRAGPSHGGGISVDHLQNNSQADVEADRESIEQRKNKKIEYMAIKRLKLGGDDALAWVEHFQNYTYLWKLRLYCKDSWVNFTGPSVEYFPESFVESFRKDELGLPEPDRQVWESFRCVPPESFGQGNATLQVQTFSISKGSARTFAHSKIEIIGQIATPAISKIFAKSNFNLLIGGAGAYRLAVPSSNSNDNGKEASVYKYSDGKTEISLSSKGLIKIQVSDADLTYTNPARFGQLGIIVDSVNAYAEVKLKCFTRGCAIDAKDAGSKFAYFPHSEDPQENGVRSDYIDIFENGKLLAVLSCQSDSNSSERCYPITFSSGGFLLVDCYVHDSIAPSCLLTKYDEKGAKDKNFATPFPDHHYRRSDTDIFSIESVEELADKKGFTVTGDFVYEKIDGLSSCQRNVCVEKNEESCVGFLGYSSSAKLSFNLQGQVTKIATLKKPSFSKEDWEKIKAECEK